MDALEDLTGVNFAASIDDSGNAAQGGDWVLETDGIPADAVYFDSERVSAFTELLANPPTINDTDPGNTAQGGGSRLTARQISSACSLVSTAAGA